jgi:hypothetical protein
METTTEKVFVLSNLTTATVNYTIPVSLSKLNWKDGFTGAAITATTQISLLPFEYKVLKN